MFLKPLEFFKDLINFLHFCRQKLLRRLGFVKFGAVDDFGADDLGEVRRTATIVRKELQIGLVDRNLGRILINWRKVKKENSR